jgi:mannose-6-phosphate isomerase-like protein (cupin superfamily)
MTLTGLRMEDPRTGLVVVVTSADEERGTGYEVVYTLPPGSGSNAFPPHWHRNWTERFEVLAGSSTCRLGRRDIPVAEGETVELPPGVTHIHPWNAGTTELRVRQTSTLLDPDPAAVRDTILSVAMLLWLSREGKVDRNGMPSMLRAAPILRRLQKGGGYLPGLPARAQEVLGDLLTGLATRRGHVAFDERCLVFDDQRG